MRKALCLFFAVALSHAALLGDLYDPFYLEFHNIGGERYYFLSEDSLVPIFYYSRAKSQRALKSVIDDARRRYKKVKIDKDALSVKTVQIKIMHSFLWQQVAFLKECCEKAKNAVTVSEQDVEFDFEDIDKDDINVTSLVVTSYVRFRINGKYYRYFLTSEQKKHFDKVLNQDSEHFRVNLSALQLTLPYRDYIPAAEVIRPYTSINAD